MNGRDFKEKNRPALPGRGLLITIVIFFSSISFALGYFVGKTVTQGNGSDLTHVAPVPPAPGSGETGQASPEKAALPAEEKPAHVSQEEPRGAEAGIATSPSSAKTAVGSPAIPLKEVAAEGHTGNTRAELPAVSGQGSRVTYTVQLAALKSASEARKLRAKLLKKGYRTYIETSTNGKKHEKIYKIRTGEFEDRKDAEMLAVKLKNTEGLKTFVAPKD